MFGVLTIHEDIVFVSLHRGLAPDRWRHIINLHIMKREVTRLPYYDS